MKEENFNILVSCENDQELFDLTLITNSLKNKLPIKIHFFDMSPLYSSCLRLENQFDYSFKAINPYKTPFKKMSKRQKINTVFKNSLILANYIEENNIKLMLTGVPLAPFRFARILKKFTHIAYMRSIILPSNFSHSFSDAINRKIKKVPFLNTLKIFNDWYCDYLFTIGENNREFFIKQKNIEKDKVIITGSFLLDYIKTQLKESENSDKKVLYFLTGAFKWHNNQAAHKEQLYWLEQFLSKFFSSRLEKEYKFVLRIHPRDTIEDYQNMIEYYKIAIDNSPTEKFLLKANPNSIVISFLSTLNFEWEYLGGKSLFVSTEKSRKIFSNFYKMLKIEPVKEVDKVLELISAYRFPKNKEVVQKVFYSHKEGNINFAVDFIIDNILKKLNRL